MRFGLVPKEAEQARPWARTRVIGPPTGLEDTVALVEVQIDEQTELGRAFRTFVYPTPAELELLKAGHPIEFSVYAQQLSPVSAAVNP